MQNDIFALMCQFVDAADRRFYKNEVTISRLKKTARRSTACSIVLGVVVLGLANQVGKLTEEVKELKESKGE